MFEHIDKEKFKKDSQSSKGSASRPEQIKEEEEDDRQRASSDPPRPSMVLSASQTRVAASSPAELTPGDEGPDRDPRANTDPGRLKSEKYPSPRSKTQPGYFNLAPPGVKTAEPGPLDVQGDGQVEGQEEKDGVLRKDTISSQEKHVDGEELGTPFPIQWVKTGSLPFGRTRHLRNPWNADREVKVSRDGTEVEPGESGPVVELTSSCRAAIHCRMGQAVVCSNDHASGRHANLRFGQPDLGTQGRRGDL